MKRDPTVQKCGTTEYLSSHQHEALTKKSTLFPTMKTLSKSSLNRFPRSGKTSELKVMTNQLQANYKPRNGCQALPQGSQLKIFWHERDEHHLSLACLLQDVYVCVCAFKVEVNVLFRVSDWTDGKSSGFIFDWGALAQDTTIWHVACSEQRHCP